MILAISSYKNATSFLKTILICTVIFQVIKITSLKFKQSDTNERIDSILSYKNAITIKSAEPSDDLLDHGVYRGGSKHKMEVSNKHDIYRYKLLEDSEIEIKKNNLNVFTEHSSYLELLELNQLINNSKKFLTKSLIYLVILFNVVLVCDLFMKKSTLSEVYLGRDFFYFHLTLNLLLILSNVLVNICYFVSKRNADKMIVNDVIASGREFSLMEYMNQWLNSEEQGPTVDLRYSRSTFTETLLNKINIAYLIAAFILMAFYIFLLQIHYKYLKIKQEKLLNKLDKPKQMGNLLQYAKSLKKQIFNLIHFLEKFPCLVAQFDESFQKYKSIKAQKLIKNKLELIVHAICVIYLLSIHDIVDVYRHALSHDLATSELIKQFNDFHVLPQNVTMDLLTNKEAKPFHNDNLQVVHSEKKYSHDRTLLEDYEQVDFSRYDNNVSRIQSTSNVKVLFFFREDTQDFGDLLTICFLVLVLVQLDSIEKIRKKILSEPEKKMSSFSIQDI